MPLPLTRLDDRTFDQLVAEGQVLLPRAAPGWTDHNVHDPGITLIELFAWLAEMNFYRLDRTSAASYRAFLRLVGIELGPPQVAETAVVLAPDSQAGAVHVLAGTRVCSADERIVFQSTWIRVSPARLVSVSSGSRDAFTDHTIANGIHEETYFALGRSPRRGDALYLGFDTQLAPSPAPVSLYVWTGTEQADRETRARLEAQWASARTDADKDCPPEPDERLLDWREHYSARTVWEYYAGQDLWAPLDDVVDETRALTLTGAVRFAAPEARLHAKGGVKATGQEERYFVRCRLAKGGYDCAPSILHVAFNAVAVRHAADVDAPRSLGGSNGGARQVFRLPEAPIVPGSTRLEVDVEGQVDQKWTEAPVWDRVGPNDQVYVLTPESGEITFGDGRVGRVPPPRGRVSARYQVGGGPAGNVSAETLIRIVPPPAAKLTVTQPFAAIGGAAGEDIADAIGRALGALAERRRAVTLGDFEQLAMQVPGVPVALAHAIADYNPDLSCLPALGSVTLVVIPPCGDPPEPSADLLRAVRTYLERRRLLTTELHVVGPHYTTVAVRARLHTSHGPTARLKAEGQSVLNRYFDPLRGGPDSKGWPAGRDVYRAEVMALLSRVPGITHVDNVELRAAEGEFSRCGNVAICRHGLVRAGSHEITVRSRSQGS
jgi:predicted phage baseplate assembly protein